MVTELENPLQISKWVEALIDIGFDGPWERGLDIHGQYGTASGKTYYDSDSYRNGILSGFNNIPDEYKQEVIDKLQEIVDNPKYIKMPDGRGGVKNSTRVSRPASFAGAQEVLKILRR